MMKRRKEKKSLNRTHGLHDSILRNGILAGKNDRINFVSHELSRLDDADRNRAEAKSRYSEALPGKKRRNRGR